MMRWKKQLEPVGGAPKLPIVAASQTSRKTVHKIRCSGISKGKHRFMSRLLGKMGVSAPDPSGQSNSNTDPGGDQSSQDPGLRDTLAGQPLADSAKPRTMSFTYAPGSKPLSQYTIRRGVGTGGFGEVYFAVSEAGKEVALKRVQRNLDVELRGASHCLNLKHVNLVSLYDICKDEDEQSWVVMEYVNGPNLRTVLDQTPTGLRDSEVRRWFSAIAAGVHHLHSAGLVHRDLKPGNVFDDMGLVKVGDYGLSKFISASHRGGHTESVGTFHYMAPEIGRGQYGREIDIYALGIVLYEMLTGQVPFDGESCHEIIVKHLTAAPDLTQIPDPYRGVIARALQKDPANRYSNVNEMLADLGWLTSSTDSPESIPMAVEYHEPVARLEQPYLEQPYPAVAIARGPAHTPQSDPPQATALAFAATSKADEPIARAVRDSVSDLKGWWSSLDQSPVAKRILVALGIVCLLLNTSWLLPVLSLIGIIYVPYYVIRQMVLHAKQQPSYAEAQRIATVVGQPARPKTIDEWRVHMRTDLRAKHSIHRAAELSTSWVAATFTVLALGIVAGVIGLRTGDFNAFTIAPYAWMGMVVLIASLSLLSMAKLWEREDGEALPRRLVLAGVGAGVGVTAYALNEFLMIGMTSDLGFYSSTNEMPQALYKGDGVPRASAMMAHFALLFAAVRWWKPVDPIRSTRLSLWYVALTVVAAWAVNQVLPIPQPYGMMMAGGIAIAIQMSAPWIDPKAKPESTLIQGSNGENIV